MRIIQISPYSWDVPGGVQVHVRELSRHLTARGHEVLVLAPGGRPYVRPDVWIVGRAIPLPVNGSVAPICFSPASGRVVRRALRDFRPDVIHVHEPLNPSTSMFGVVQANAPVVATFHANVPRGTMQSVAYGAFARMLRPVWDRIDCRIAVSDAARHSICSRMGDCDVRIVPNGANVDVFAGARPATLPGGRTLLFVGRLEPRKGFPIAVAAFERIARRYDDVRLVVVGDGADRGAADVLEPALRDRVQMLGYVSSDELPGYFRAADIFVGPSLGSESFGIVLVEAMAAGRPIVASNIPGYREVTRDGIEGLLVPPSDPDRLAAAVGRLLDEPSLAHSLGRNGAMRARSFAWSAIVDELEEVYQLETGIGLPRRSRVSPSTSPALAVTGVTGK